ncbi:response regulator transcription factor [Synechococcus sp. MU1643]|uniref:response regulator transcription factor n=1 Tax=Synechococcus sp. MU1643 TaxID=2508349 RepID=UPI00351D8245
MLRGLCKGLSNQEIADQLHLSIETTKQCVTAPLRKLNAKSRNQAVLIAFQRNLVDPPLPIPRWTPLTLKVHSEASPRILTSLSNAPPPQHWWFSASAASFNRQVTPPASAPQLGFQPQKPMPAA